MNLVEIVFAVIELVEVLVDFYYLTVLDSFRFVFSYLGPSRVGIIATQIHVKIFNFFVFANLALNLGVVFQQL